MQAASGVTTIQNSSKNGDLTQPRRSRKWEPSIRVPTELANLWRRICENSPEENRRDVRSIIRNRIKMASKELTAPIRLLLGEQHQKSRDPNLFTFGQQGG
jgi:hypothetical protein